MSKKTTLAALALIMAGGFGLWSVTSGNVNQTLAPVSSAVAQETAPAADVPAIEVKDMTLGPVDAKVTVIEYASYTCPHCATFHANVFKDLKKDYIDTGKIHFIYREVYFDRYGLWASMVARCGGDMKYFGVQEMLYKDVQTWAGSDDPNVVVGNLKKIGRTAGMDDAQLDACMQDGAMAQAMVDRFEASMKEHDVQGTPTLVINGTKHSNMTYAEMKTILDAELAK
ncbi:MAG: DsbA family protein [Pseudotabrizicola sp.]|uniref:DsbA family protein n=1 Tax=Pseudotabrizicola sp. TaxID=2939647 RepID=UPI00272FB24F|nr:DsbA family protein [Pseudotabrizicola sp.]MDP2082483.1 DsbA family protein [Pseudotabrizicola sp.]MDZ7572789.1 DsbA family protein [Pseudotabrizicola sp.]